jgi:hypothetical protein
LLLGAQLVERVWGGWVLGVVAIGVSSSCMSRRTWFVLIPSSDGGFLIWIFDRGGRDER